MPEQLKKDKSFDAEPCQTNNELGGNSSTWSTSSSREVRIRVPTLSVIDFSRRTLPPTKAWERALLGDLVGKPVYESLARVNYDIHKPIIWVFWWCEVV